MSAAIIRLAVCRVQDAKPARRTLIGALVDEAAGLATKGARPACRVYPSSDGVRLLAALSNRVAEGRFGPEISQYFRTTLPQIAAGADALIDRGETPCILVGTYDVDDRPDGAVGDL